MSKISKNNCVTGFYSGSNTSFLTEGHDERNFLVLRNVAKIVPSLTPGILKLRSYRWVELLLLLSLHRGPSCNNGNKCQSAMSFFCLVVCWSECGLEEGSSCDHGKNDLSPK